MAFRRILGARAAPITEDDLTYVPVRIAAGVEAIFAVDPSSDDPLGRWLVSNGYPHEPPNQLFQHLATRDARVVDVGAHIGTFSLAAAAAGCDVVAIEGSPANVRLLLASKARNAFDRLQVVHAAATDFEGSLSFIPKQAWGEIAVPDMVQPGEEQVELPAVTVDRVVERAGWNRVHLVKIDVEGAELSVLRGMQQTLAAEPSPHVIIEINELQLRKHGTTGSEVKQHLADLGYRLFFVDRDSPGDLVETLPTHAQPDCVADFYATRAVVQDQLGPWRVCAPFSPAEVFQRFEAAAASDHFPYRAFAATALGEAIEAATWPLDAEFRGLLSSLAADPHEAVREYAGVAVG
ncbi:MAG: FkbM family methyltransferase, partial [Acidimicrobiales bacterium]|nr:FkbM family methyltransferase [Acidimicrobiales bacterium]